MSDERNPDPHTSANEWETELIDELVNSRPAATDDARLVATAIIKAGFLIRSAFLHPEHDDYDSGLSHYVVDIARELERIADYMGQE